MVLYFASNSPPDGFLECNGAILSSSTYPTLVALLGTTYGAYGQLPDLRAEFIRGWDHSRGIDPSRSFGSSQLDASERIQASLFATMFGGPSGGIPGWSASGAMYVSGDVQSIIRANSVYSSGYNTVGFDSSRVVKTASENRSRNVALLPCIKY